MFFLFLLGRFDFRVGILFNSEPHVLQNLMCDKIQTWSKATVSKHKDNEAKLITNSAKNTKFSWVIFFKGPICKRKTLTKIIVEVVFEVEGNKLASCFQTFLGGPGECILILLWYCTETLSPNGTAAKKGGGKNHYTYVQVFFKVSLWWPQGYFKRPLGGIWETVLHWCDLRSLYFERPLEEFERSFWSLKTP